MNQSDHNTSVATPPGITPEFNAYIEADIEVRRINDELLENSRAYKEAVKLRDAAWEKYQITCTQRNS